MNNITTEMAYLSISKEFEIDDMLGIRWRTDFGIRLGLDQDEAYRLALGLAGINACAAVRP